MKYNTTSTPKNKTTNLAGGDAYTQSPELELASLMLTSFMKDDFYKSETQTVMKLKKLMLVCDPKFVAQCAIYARTEFGMRSVTHVVASELAKYASGKEWAKSFYDKIVYRPDDMLEILSYHTQFNGKIPNSIKKGFAKAFDRFDTYSLAKYRGEGKGMKLVDIVNLVHPVPVERNADAISKLIKGELKSTETWESMLSAAGSNTEAKRKVWTDLINENKLGYFALLRNLKNLIEQAPDIMPKALEKLTDAELIKKSLVLPFRFTTAFEEINKLTSSKIVRDTLNALNKAVDISLNNVPKFEGDTLVVLDVSGSMEGKPSQIGSLFASVLVKACNADMMVFADRAEYRNVNTADSTITIANQLRFDGGGTNFHSIFQTANKPYDRIIILSDMQGWLNQYTPVAEYNKWKAKYSTNPFVYSFDLAGNGTMQFPEDKVFCLAGFGDKTLELMKYMEQDKKALINTIKKIVL